MLGSDHALHATSRAPLRVPSVLRALDRVLSPSGFPYGSKGHLFMDAHFGRDSLEVSEDLLRIRPAIARCVIKRLAVLQGVTLDARTEEERGKIHHEHRALVIDGQRVGEESRNIFHGLARAWQLATTEEDLEALTEWTQYGTVDATPLYVRLVASYCHIYGPAILDERVESRREDGAATIRESVRHAVDWIAGKLERSELGLLEFCHMSPRGHRFQAWKDGGTSYLHPDGRFANYNAPIASIEVQGLAHDALAAAPGLLRDAPATERERWHALAHRLQRAVVDLFWMPEEAYFAMAVDRDPRTGDERQVKLISSNSGALLDTGVFDTLGTREREKFIPAIVNRIYSGEFLTPVGIRCSSLIHKDLLDYPAYQSSYTVWHKETYDVAKGFRRQGFSALARDLESRLLNGVNLSGDPGEFLYVFPDNRVAYGPLDGAGRDDAEEIAATNLPEKDQAWTISAALAVKWCRGRRGALHPEPASPQRALEQRKSEEIRPVKLLRTLGEVEEAFPADSFRVNTGKGFELERAYVKEHGLPPL